MDYLTARPMIRSGDLLAWSHRRWKTWHDIKVQLVRIFTQSEYSHVGVAWCIGERVFVLEAVTPLVRIYPLSKCDSFYWIPLKTKWTSYTEVLALDMVGDSYSQKDAIKAFFNLPINNNKWECAEYVKTILETTGIDLGKVLTPAALVQKALEQDNELIFIRKE